MKKTIGIILLTILPLGSFAYTLGNKTVSRVHVNVSSGVYFKTDQAMSDPHNCGSITWYKLKENTYSKEAFSILLAARSTGKQVDISLNGCAGNYPAVDWLNTHD